MPLASPEDQKGVHAARRLCELFRGRFSQEVAVTLIEDFGGELQAVDFVLNEKEDVVAEYLKKNDDYVRDMRADSKKIADLLENGISYEIQQFACADCTRSWWKKVPVRKQVSKCHRCHTKYDPVPEAKQWGWAKFVCSCSNEFHAFGEMGITRSECYKCGNQVLVTKVLPPRRRIGTRKSNNSHSCNGVNCFGQDGHGDYFSVIPATAAMNMSSFNSQHHSRNNTYNYNVTASTGGAGPGKKGKRNKNDVQDVPEPSGDTDPTPVCIHPKSHQPGRGRIRTPSKKHISTGSTVNTFLTQGSLDTATVSVAFTLDTICED